MKISEIYKKYFIAYPLKMHMLRVAAVAQTICDNFDGPVDFELILKTCLLHDMGNIVKFDFNYFDKQWFKPQGIVYWKNLQDKFIEKYGSNDQLATIKILKELSVDKKIYRLIKQTGFLKTDKIYESPDYNLKILYYSDLRVSPYGIVSVRERFKEAQKRYRFKPESILNKGDIKYLINKNFSLEKQIFFKSKIKPNEITDKNIISLVNKLNGYEIKLAD